MPYRTLCEVLGEMRSCCKTLDFSYLMALIEEAQVMGNKMEAGLYAKGDYEQLEKDRKKLEQTVNELRQEKASLKKAKGKSNG